MLPVVRNRGILKKGAWDFYMRRAKRILPPYYLAIAFSFLCVLTVLSKKMDISFPASLPAIKQWLTFHGLLIQNWQPFFNPRYSEISSFSLLDMMSMPPERRGQMMGAMGARLDINGPLWSIAVEWQIYFFFPLLVMLWRKIGAGATVAVALLGSYSFFLKFPGHAMAHGWMAPHYLGLFALGMFAANVAHGTEERWEKLFAKRFWHPLAYVLWGAVFLININPLMGLVYSYLVDLIAGPASMCLLIAASKTGTNRLRDLLSRPKLVFIGTFSYSIYLLHDPLLRVLLNTMLSPLAGVKVLQYYLLVTVGLSIIIGIAYVFHLYCERPFMNTKPNLKRSEPSLDGVPLK
jgi:peptidoglycan/LPS O-acetylase OafA/YrhL